jgi:hypothetical protein
MSTNGAKRVIDLTSESHETYTKKTKTEDVKQEEVECGDDDQLYEQDDVEYEWDSEEHSKDDESGLDPILFIVDFDGDRHERSGDHPVLSGITGYHCQNFMSFYTDEMHKELVGSLSNLTSTGGGEDSNGPPYSDDDKLMTLYEVATDEATPGKSYRATVVFSYPF